MSMNQPPQSSQIQLSNSQIQQHDRQLRSVFVGNIAYDATEAELTTLFSQVGPVVHFRYVHDRESGKPKGYGFCEYVDQQTAESAVRNLNGHEFHGRSLRVDSAVNSAGTQNRFNDAAREGGGRPPEEGPYGEPVEPAKAPEAISRAVASLPPEQMFDLMKQMKLCIQNNPHEARTMLLQNPQLAYALLQAAVVMRVLDPQVAMSILHRETALTGPIGVSAAPTTTQQASPRMVPPPVSTSSQPQPPFNHNQSPYAGMSPMQPDFPPTSSAPQHQPGPSHYPPQHHQQQQQQQQHQAAMTRPNQAPFQAPSAEEEEKAKLIAQVLQLTDEQINMLPADQKQSVLILREQLRSGQH